MIRDVCLSGRDMRKKIFFDNKSFALIFLLFLLIFRIAISIWWLYHNAGGFFMLFGDSCQRTIEGYHWVNHGIIKGFPHGSPWLPLHFLIIAIFYKIIPDLVLITPIISLIFFSGSVILIFLITKRLFNSNDTIALLASLLACYYPWPFYGDSSHLSLGLSISGMSDPVFHFFVLGGVYFYLEFIHDKRVKNLILSSILFLLSTMLRYEGWGIVVVIAALLLANFIKNLQKGRSDWVLLLCVFIILIFIPFWLIYQYRSTGDALHFARWAATFVTIKGGPLVRMFYYPKLLLSIDPLIVSLAVLGVIIALYKNINKMLIFPFIVIAGSYIFILIVFSTVIGPLGHQYRPLILSLLMFLPFVSCAIATLCPASCNKRFGFILLFLLSLIFMSYYSKRIIQIQRFGFPIEESALSSARLVEKTLLGHQEKNSAILVERTENGQHIWDIKVFEILFPDHAYFDREERYNTPKDELAVINNPSLFEYMNDDQLIKYCKTKDIKVIVTSSGRYVGRIKGFADKVDQQGRYTLFSLRN